MPTDINVSQLVINKLTQAQFNEAQSAGNISESELYFVTDSDNSNKEVPSGGTSGQILAKKSNTDYDTQWVDIEIPEVDMSQYSTTEQMNAAIAAAIEAAFANIARAEEVTF